MGEVGALMAVRAEVEKLEDCLERLRGASQVEADAHAARERHEGRLRGGRQSGAWGLLLGGEGLTGAIEWRRGSCGGGGRGDAVGLRGRARAATWNMAGSSEPEECDSCDGREGEEGRQGSSEEGQRKAANGRQNGRQMHEGESDGLVLMSVAEEEVMGGAVARARRAAAGAVVEAVQSVVEVMADNQEKRQTQTGRQEQLLLAHEVRRGRKERSRGGHERQRGTVPKMAIDGRGEGVGGVGGGGLHSVFPRVKGSRGSEALRSDGEPHGP